MKKKLIIIGAGSVGGHIYLNKSNYGLKGEILGFLDDDKSKLGKELFGLKVLGTISDLFNYDKVNVILGIAFPNIKYEILNTLIKMNQYEFPTLVSKNAWVSKNVDIDEGSIIYPGSSINYNSKIGKFVLINLNCAIGHDTRISDFSSLSPSVSTGGHTKIKTGVQMGIGSSTIQNIRIGEWSEVGGNAIVTKDIKANSIVKGVPAR